ncbi:hypothetical protein PWG14_27535 [Chromobacterium amazonense]|uniref:hypothetical protein n=1 Tax=Chromobacterium amazonense TaxID=1382803 RepID=UPI00237D7FB8|nr:hypothetical protein [Chromobacterium amazonense]MDE1716222.1 hypothetical protein [Chromobacterium amazonense]
MIQNNSTFIGGHPTWANACVGENGFPDYWDYAKGFSQAATILIDLVLHERGLKHSVDELVYPVCFNMRHSVELRLKGAISELSRLESLRSRSFQFDLSGSHDIGNIWKFFKNKARSADDRYESIIDRLDKKISDIAKVDATGQTFRYPLNTDSKKHLVDVAVINFVALKESFAELEAALDDLHRLNRYLRDEYSWGSFTNRLSRKNLSELALLLPPRSTWADKSFTATKTMIKDKFQIGSKELSDAIKCIESHFEFSPEIEILIPLLGIKEADIHDFFGHWFKQHDLPSDKDPIDLEEGEWCLDKMFEDLKNSSRIQAEVWSAVQENITPELLAGLSALFYFARELNFSECYARIYELGLKEAQEAFSHSTDFIRKKYLHIFDKTNAVYNILRSLYFLRKPELADRLVATYDLDVKFSWLDEARSRVLFRKPDYCGYMI